MSHRSEVMVKRSYLQMSLFTLFATIVWIVISVYQAFMSPGEVKVDKELLTPLNPNLNEEVFKILIDKNQVEFTQPAPEIPDVSVEAEVASKAGNLTTSEEEL